MLPLLLPAAGLLLLLLLLRRRRRKAAEQEGAGGRPFSCMPGPAPWPLLGTLPHYWLGRYSWGRLHTSGALKCRQFGDCVREDVLPGVSVVWLFHPRDIRAIYRAEGREPARRSHTALASLRQAQPALYATGGLLPTNGPEWRRIRGPLQRPLLGTLAMGRLLPALDSLMEEAAGYLGSHRALLADQDLLPELEKIFMESTGLLVLGQRLGAIRPDLATTSLPARLMAAARDINSAVLETDNGLPVWRVVETAAYRRTREGAGLLGRVARERVGERREQLEEGEQVEEASILDQVIRAEGLDSRDVTTAIEDFLLAGIHTTAYTTSFLLHHLALHPAAQAALAREARRLLAGARAGLTRAELAGATYAQAVLRESLRLNPVAVGGGRILAVPAVLGGYSVPAGTVVVAMNQVSCRQERFFPSPDTFHPERWLADSPHPCNAECAALHCGPSTDPFLLLPFGHGPRACIGRRIAEDSVLLLLLHLSSQYRLQWTGGQLDCRSELINRPDAELSFRLHRWRDEELRPGFEWSAINETRAN
jgi:ecdysteroid 25-hydroxylase CYP302A1